MELTSSHPHHSQLSSDSPESSAQPPFVLRLFTTGGLSPYDSVSWEYRSCTLRGAGGTEVFHQDSIEVPQGWSQMALTVVASKYLHGDLQTGARENSIRALIERVVSSIDAWANDGDYFADRRESRAFHDELAYLLLNQFASFNSPVWFNVGIDKHPQCSACFILSVDDSMDSLLELQRTEGILFKSGSGCGTNLSSIRSSREKLAGGGIASGPISFMRGYDAWAGSIKSGGKTRRAAKMQILNVEHPDIREFIRCKAEEEKKAWALIEAGYDGGFSVPGGAYDSVGFQNANLSIRVTDEFMEAVINDAPFHTRRVVDGEPCEAINARELLRLAAEAAHVCGDPGLQYDTTINQWHTCPQSGRINASNPCSEYMHLDNSACNLASINLLKFLGDDGTFAVEQFLHTVSLLIVAQDSLIDGASYPTQSIADCARSFRQLGLGFANLGALLMSLGVPYDSEEGRGWAAALTSLMSAQAYLTSARMAARLSPFEGFQANREDMLGVMRRHLRSALEGEYPGVPHEIVSASKELWEAAVESGNASGYRNSQVTVLAPTGTISFMMDCDTTGIEPDIALVKYKKLSDGGLLKLVNKTVPRGLRTLGYADSEIEEIVAYIDTHDTIEGSPALHPEHLSVFDCAFKPVNGVRSIDYRGHLKMMAAVQPFLSGAISKTVNLPHEATVDDIFDIYVSAWRMGLKSVALYRDGSKRTQPLNTGLATEAVSTAPSAEISRRKLSDERNSITHKFSIGGLEGYLTVGLFDDGAPGEIFLVVAKEGSTLSGVMDAFATSVSIALQYGVPLKTLIKKFTYSRFEPSGFTNNPAIPFAQSIFDYVFRWLAIKFLTPEEQLDLGLRVFSETTKQPGSAVLPKAISPSPSNPGHHAPSSNGLALLTSTFETSEDAPPCTRCGSSLMVRQAGCYYCLNCGSQGGCG